MRICERWEEEGGEQEHGVRRRERDVGRESTVKTHLSYEGAELKGEGACCAFRMRLDL